MLISLALMPLVAPQFWHRHHKKVLIGWIIVFLAAFGIHAGPSGSLFMILYALFHHYIPFMAIITVLFTIGGGIHIRMRGKASPLINTGLLGVGALLSKSYWNDRGFHAIDSSAH
ncbi:MAG: sodium:proton antiporter [Candidatus Saccharimonadaceae bacterium]